MSAGPELEQSSVGFVDGDGSLVVRATGELDLATAPALQEKLSRACAIGTQGVVLDLSELEFIDSTGVRAILAALADAESRGCELSLVPGPDRVQRVFDLTGLAERLPFRRR